MQYERFELTGLPVSPWKNGGGTTTELACWPRGADLSSFDARVSIASITSSGPFSMFPGIDRTIMLVDGAGLRLRSRTGGIEHRLARQWEPYSFAGELAIDCDLLGDASRDFNVMVRRSAWRAEIHVFRDQAQVASSARGLLFAASGSWEAAPEGTPLQLQVGAGIRWDGNESSWLLRPVHEAGRPAQVNVAAPTHVLVAVLLRPVLDRPAQRS